MAKNKLLLLHGGLGSEADFSELAWLLMPEYLALTMDFRGHGGNLIDNDFSINVFVNDTKNLIDFLNFADPLNVAPFNIFGYSMGGYVALNLALTHPNLVNKIITLGTKFNWSKESAEQQVKMLNPDVIEQKVPKFAESLRIKHAPQDWKTLMRKTADMMINLGNGDAMTTEDFSRIEHEVLICVGSEDNMVTHEESAEVASHLKNGKLKIIEGFKHPIETVDKNKLAEIINEFL